MKSAVKVMERVFWDANGIIFIDYGEKGRKLYEEYYSSLLAQLGKEIKKKYPYLVMKKALHHQDNACVHACGRKEI